MKICIVEERYPPRSSGGASNYAKRSADALSEKGHKVVVLTTKPYKGLPSLRSSVRMDGDVKVVEFVPLNIYDGYKAGQVPVFLKPVFYAVNLWNPHHYFFFRRLLETEKPNVVHIHSIDGLSLSLFDSINSLGIPSVITLHAYALLCPKINLIRTNREICRAPHIFCSIHRALKRMIADSKPTMAIAPSQFVLDIFSDEGFFHNCAKERLPLFLDISARRTGAGQPRKSDKEFNILFVGRLAFHKGVQVLIEAFKKLPYDHIRLHIVGWGDYEAHLKKIAEDDDRIEFHIKIPERELWLRYEMSDVTIVPSIWFENSPYVIYESFSKGIPVVGSRIGGIPELIEEGHNGFLFDPGNVEELTAILNGLVNDGSRMRQLKEGAKDSASKYDISAHVDRLEGVYERAMKLPKR